MFPVSCSSSPIIRKQAIWRDAQSEDITSSIKIWQMLCWEPSYCNSYSNIFFLKAAYKLKFVHYIVENISHPNCTKQKLYALIIFVWGIIAWEPHILRRKKNFLNMISLRLYWQEIAKSLSLALPFPVFPLLLEAFLLPSLACPEDQRPT